jgi:hypothetical protein
VTIPAYESSATVAVTPSPTLSQAATSTVVLTLSPGSSYTVGAGEHRDGDDHEHPPHPLRGPDPADLERATSSGSGTATILVSADGSLASVSVSFSNLSSDEVVAHLAIGGDENNGTYVFNLPQGQVSNLTWTPTATGTYSAAQIIAALGSGNLYVEIDSATFPAASSAGQFITSTGSQVFTAPPAPPAINLSVRPGRGRPALPHPGHVRPDDGRHHRTPVAGLLRVDRKPDGAARDLPPRGDGRGRRGLPQHGPVPVTQNNRQAAWWLVSRDGARPAAPEGRLRPQRDLRHVRRRLPAGQRGRRLADYYDLLANDAFVNFRSCSRT